jgi:hypothetical protein
MCRVHDRKSSGGRLGGPSFDGQTGFVPLLHSSSQNTDLIEAGCTKCLRSYQRTFVGPTYKYDRLSLEAGKFRQASAQFGDGNVPGPLDMAERPDKLIRSSHIDDVDRRGTIELALEIANVDPGK